MAKDLEVNAEIQQPPKREGRNMIMFLSPRKQNAVKSILRRGIRRHPFLTPPSPGGMVRELQQTV
jgi:hypothetical protein